MIYHLMKRDPAWRFAPYLAVATVILLRLLPSAGDHPLLSYQMASIVYMTCSFGLRVHERCSLFAAALPVEGRQFFMARLLSLLTFIWLPVLAAAVAGSHAAGLIEAAAVCTVAVLLVQSVRVDEISAPAWLVNMVAPVLLLGGIALAYFSATAVRTGCAVISTILFVKIRAGIPKSFQVARVKAVPRRPENRNSYRTPVWWPGFRSLYTWQSFLFFPGLLVFSVTGSWLMTSIWVAMVITQSHPGLRWLFALPISRRKLLWSVLIPPIALIMSGCAMNILSRHATAEDADSHRRRGVCNCLVRSVRDARWGVEPVAGCFSPRPRDSYLRRILSAFGIRRRRCARRLASQNRAHSN